MMKISIVIPFFNENKHITSVIDGLSKYKLPIVLVDDGSTDELKLKTTGQVTLLTHKINLGKGAAMKTGAQYAFESGADAVVFMDGDNQHKASDLPKFIEALEKGNCNAVFGVRRYNNNVPMVRYLGNKFASVVLFILFGIKVSDVLCGFKAVTKKGYKDVYWDSTGYGVETEMIARAGKAKLKFSEVPIESIYHDKNKGVTILDAVGIMGEIVKWRFTI